MVNIERPTRKSKRLSKKEQQLLWKSLSKKQKRAVKRAKTFYNPFDYGEWYGDYSPKGARLVPRKNTNEVIEASYMRDDCWRKQLANYEIVQHCKGERTLYATGAVTRKQPKSMVCIEIDIQKSRKLGSEQGAIEAAEYIKAKFPGAYVEQSTGGKGRHCYIVVDRCGMGGSVVNELYERLEYNLNKECCERFDIEMVEVKMTCGQMDFKNYKYKAGALCKMPRTILDRPEEFLAIAEISAMSLLKLEPKPKETAKQAGSVGGLIINMNMYGSCRAIASQCDDKIKASTDLIVVEDDIAPCLYGFQYKTANPNEDGSMPVAAIEAIWMELYNQGLTSRKPNRKRIAAIKNYLSDRGLIDWTDPEYVRPRWAANGDKIKGKASRWCLAEELMHQLELGAQQLELEADKADKDSKCGSVLSLSLTLWVGKITEWINSLVECDERDRIRCYPVDDMQLFHTRLDEIVKTWQPSDYSAA